MKTSELNGTSTDAPETNKSNSGPETKNTQLIEKEEVEGTPFTVVKQDDVWFILMGKYRLDPTPFPTKKEAIRDARRFSWDKIVQVAQIMIIANSNQMAMLEQQINELATTGKK